MGAESHRDFSRTGFAGDGHTMNVQVNSARFPAAPMPRTKGERNARPFITFIPQDRTRRCRGVHSSRAGGLLRRRRHRVRPRDAGAPGARDRDRHGDAVRVDVSSTQSSAPTSERESSPAPIQAPGTVIGDDAANFRLGTTTPGDGKPKDVQVEASARQKDTSGFDEARMEILDRDSNGVLRFPLSDGSARVMVNFEFEAATDVNCAVDMEVYDAEGHETLSASTRLESFGDNECSITATGGFKTGDSYAEFSEPGEYYIVIQAQQADHEPIRLAQKVLITSGEISGSRG